MRQDEIIRIFPERLQKLLMAYIRDWDQLQEIHIRCFSQLILRINGEKVEMKEPAWQVSRQDFREIMDHISNYSFYALEEEIRNGFLTIPGGHRIGLCGRVVYENGRIRTMRNICFLNLRVAHEIKGCADRVLPLLYEKDRFLSTLIVSPPGFGKTTMLRDLIRRLADGSEEKEARRVAVIDERSEIGACYQGIPQNDLGMHCDVLDGCRKSEGIYRVLRSMAPEIIAVDEIGGKMDFEALEVALTSGCGLLATIHGSSYEQLLEKEGMQRLIVNGMFSRILFLTKVEQGKKYPGVVTSVRDAQGQELLL